MTYTKSIPLDGLRLDGDTQPRTKLDEATIGDYAESYRRGAPMPPLTVFYDGEHYWLADGFHRWQAALEAGLDRVPCEVHKGSLNDARWHACGANRTHGLPRNNADKQRAVKAALRHPTGAALSDGEIAEHIGVSDRMVAKCRAELTAKVSKSPERSGRGKVYSTEKIGRGRGRKIEVPVAKPADEPESQADGAAPDADPVTEPKPRTIVVRGKTCEVRKEGGFWRFRNSGSQDWVVCSPEFVALIEETQRVTAPESEASR